MKKFFIPLALSLVTLLLMFTSCSTINRNEREHYNRQNAMRHGIIPKPGGPERIDQASANRGEALFKTKCAQCHGTTGLGDGPLAPHQKKAPADLVELVQQVPAFELFMSVSQSDAKMPGWTNPLNERQLFDISSYLQQLGQKDQLGK